MARHFKPLTPTVRKASESVISRTLSNMLGTPRLEKIEEVCLAFTERGTLDSPLSEVLGVVVGLYPWVCHAPREVMSPATTPLVEHLISRPGQAFVVKDESADGDDSLWVAIADPPPEVQNAIERMVCRGLFHTFQVGSEFSRVIAIQINSCQL